MPLVCGKRTWASNLQDLVATSHWTGLLFNTFLEEGRRDQVIALHSWRARESCSRCLEESLRGTKNPGLRWTHSPWLFQPKEESLSRQNQRLKHRLHRKPLSWLKWKGKKSLTTQNIPCQVQTTITEARAAGSRYTTFRQRPQIKAWV